MKKKSTRACRKQEPIVRPFIEFNVNNHVLVKLTDHGRACLRKNYDDLNAACGGKLGFKFALPKEDKDGWSRWQAWSLMSDLGPHISIGMNPPFETTIRIEQPNVELSRAASAGGKAT